MAVDFNTTGLDWKKHVRERAVFACWVTTAWHTDRRCQRQLAYARELGKPVYFLVRPHTRVPDTRPGELVTCVATIEEAAQVLQEIMDGAR